MRSNHRTPDSKAASASQRKIKLAQSNKRLLIVPGEGIPCPRCGQPTQIREHREITARQLRQPYYYWRWFCCTNTKCRTTLIMRPEYKVENDRTVGISQSDRFQVLRNLEAEGKIWSEIDKDGNLRFYATECKPRPADHDRKIIMSIGTAARKRRLQNKR